MSSSELIRWGGLCAVVGGALLVISDLWGLITEGFGESESFSEAALSPSYAITTGISLLAAMLLLFGLVGFNLRQSEGGGVLGRVGFVVAFLGTALVVGVTWALFFVVPALAVEAPQFLDTEETGGSLETGFIVSFGLLSVGWALFGMGALRSRVYPRWGAIVLIIAALIQFLPLPGTGLVFGVGVALLGLLSLSGAGTSAAEPSRVR
jgi:uncharacterized membrane protein (DUF485 family)